MGHPPGLVNSTSRALLIAAQASKKPCLVIWGGRGQKPRGHTLLPGPSFSGCSRVPLCTGTVLDTEARLRIRHIGWSQCSWIGEGKERQAPESAIDHGNSSSDSGTGAQAPSFIQRNTCPPVANNVADLHLLGRGNHRHPRYLRYFMF